MGKKTFSVASFEDQIVFFERICKNDQTKDPGIVTELMSGALDKRLRSMRESGAHSVSVDDSQGKFDHILQMIKWLSNVAGGMVYLADNKILHKDLRKVFARLQENFSIGLEHL